MTETPKPATDDGKEEIELELDDEQIAHLEAIATRRGCTIDEVVEGFIREAIREAEAARGAETEDAP